MINCPLNCMHLTWDWVHCITLRYAILLEAFTLQSCTFTFHFLLYERFTTWRCQCSMMINSGRYKALRRLEHNGTKDVNNAWSEGNENLSLTSLLNTKSYCHTTKPIGTWKGLNVWNDLTLKTTRLCYFECTACKTINIFCLHLKI